MISDMFGDTAGDFEFDVKVKFKAKGNGKVKLLDVVRVTPIAECNSATMVTTAVTTREQVIIMVVEMPISTRATGVMGILLMLPASSVLTQRRQ